ncbi:MAG: hydrogenase formation protein HypD [Ignavibacteriales bacterium]|nr:hydrogenase formation protein HypD [Ignavibacteriales bacterium]
MRFIDEYRDSKIIRVLAEKIKSISKNSWSIMEVCGGQTHTILKYGLEELLPDKISLIHGPGCPVCVTSVEVIDKALYLVSNFDVILASYGDMLRVPGSNNDLLKVKASGGDVRIVYSPIDALKIAEAEKEKAVVFFAVGFETTAPATAHAIKLAEKKGIHNFFTLCAHVLIPPAIEAILSSDSVKVNGLIAPGHVCSIIGYNCFEPISLKYKIPIVITGFEPIDIIQGILLNIIQLESGRHTVENQYSRTVRKEGNLYAKKIMDEVFEIIDRDWRGIGIIKDSGLKLKQDYSDYDAEIVFNLNVVPSNQKSNCIAGEILRGIKKPIECAEFGKACSPSSPVGAPMVSSEGACAAFFKYKRQPI